jgi:hypothetical protein
MKDLKDSGLVTQLVVVATMMPKVKHYIDDLIAENEALKVSHIKLEKGIVKDLNQRQMNEPVAWMLADKEVKCIRSIMAVQHDFVPQGCVEIPLYTHPVKELTDEEINELANTYLYVLNDVPYADDIKNFARAILRKAQK